MKLIKMVAMALSATVTFSASMAMAGITLADQGKSDYSILLPDKAPRILTEAAQEMQKDIALATGATLTIVKSASADQAAGHYISLGATKQAAAAGFSAEGMPPEGYRIVTKDNNLYILGPDTPDGQWTPDNGVSNGSANGVYVFLEQYLGVRWLMPGDIGRDVPQRQTFTLDDLDEAGAPMFNYRLLGHTCEYMDKEQYQKASRWLNHMRVGGSGSGDKVAFRGSAKPAYEHNWWRTINRSADPNPLAHGSSDVHTKAVKDLHEKHPDWFAMDAHGNRPLPKNGYAKLETTNPELVKWFAEQAIRFMKANDRPNYFSLSPSDGKGWSQSPQSKALYDPSPATLLDPEAEQGQPSMSSLILKWYHDISQIVAEEYPQGRLGGYIYAAYLFPPQKYQMKLPDNFTPTVAFSPSYGFGLYREETQKAFHYVMDSWAKVAPKNWYYYDLPNQLFRQYVGNVGSSKAPVGFPGSTAIVEPAAPEILNTIFRTLVKDHITGTILYGISSWSSSAMSNYIMAAMEWNPKLDAHEVQREWLNRAYGPAAGKVMETFYHDLDGWFADYYRSGKSLSYHLTFDMLRDLYARHYQAMEKTYLQAAAQPMTEIQQKRLQLIGDNLIVLQWRLRNVGFLPIDFHSKLTLDDKEVIALIEKPNPDFPMFPGAVETDPASAWSRPAAFKGKVEWSEKKPGRAVSNPFPSVLREGMIVFYPSKDGEIRIEPELVTQSAYFATYSIQDKTGQKIARGVLNKGTPVVISARANQPYYLYVVPRKGINYRLKIQNAAVAQIGYDAKGKTLSLWGQAAGVQVAQIPGAQVGVSGQEDGTVEIIRPFAGTNQVNFLMGTGNYSEARVLASLTDGWKFRPSPDNKLAAVEISRPSFDDSQWKTISSLNWWQMQGFSDYHGPAWYRMEFEIPKLKENEQTRFYCGSADGNMEIYFNGRQITGHQLGPAPEYEGWNKSFSRHIPHNWWKPGKNILAVKVTSKNDTSASGITGGVAVIGRVPVKK